MLNFARVVLFEPLDSARGDGISLFGEATRQARLYTYTFQRAYLTGLFGGRIACTRRGSSRRHSITIQHRRPPALQTQKDTPRPGAISSLAATAPPLPPATSSHHKRELRVASGQPPCYRLSHVLATTLGLKRVVVAPYMRTVIAAVTRMRLQRNGSSGRCDNG